MPILRLSYRPGSGRFRPALGKILFAAAILCCAGRAVSGDRTVVQLKDFDLTEVKSAGLTLGADTRVKIHALGAGAGKEPSSLYAYGWIINAETREPVWKMNRSETAKSKDDRVFDGEILLRKGSYEVYFTAYAFATQSLFSSITVNIDRRERIGGEDGQKKRSLMSWLNEFFGGDMEQEWKRRSKAWGIEITVPDNAPVTSYAAPKEFPNILYRAVHLGEREHIRQPFTISKPVRRLWLDPGRQEPQAHLGDESREHEARGRCGEECEVRPHGIVPRRGLRALLYHG
jgi:hypothetical protein